MTQTEEFIEVDAHDDNQGPNIPETVLAEAVHLRIPSRPEWIVPTVEYLAERAVRCGVCGGERSPTVTMALHEALTNSVVHGNLEIGSALKEGSDDAFAEALADAAADPELGNRVVDIRTTYDGDAFRWIFTDQGKGFDIAGVLTRAASDDPEILLSSGRGIVLMQALLDDVRFEMGGRRVELTIRRQGEEKRQHLRRSVQETVRVAPVAADGTVDWQAAYDALARNLSEGGIGLLQNRLASSQRVLIGLDWEGKVLYVPAEVRNCEPLGEGLVQLGCRFQLSESPGQPATGPGSLEELQVAVAGILATLDTPALAPHEQRVHRRVEYAERIGISGGPGPAIGFARNLSKGGMSFLVHQPLPLEKRLLSLPRRDNPPLRLQVRIVRCALIMEGVYEVGAQFEHLA